MHLLPSRLRLLTGTLALSVIALAGASQASAATTVGETFVPDGTCGRNIFLQPQSPGSAYVIPDDGVVTSWSHRASEVSPVANAQLTIARDAGSGNYTVIAQGAKEAIVPAEMNTFATRVPVAAGDLLGIGTAPSGGACVRFADGGYGAAYGDDDLTPGTTAPFTAQTGLQIDVSAVVEPDADADGYGDESQDACPSDAMRQTGCAAPDTRSPEARFDKTPAKKTKRKRASFAFSTDEPGATFTCALDGGTFRECTSPLRVKVKPGRHALQVEAEDAAGNESAVLSYRWKVKKRR